MMNVTVLGAGYMGSAITFPLSDNNLEINLWGTWLDDRLIESSINGYHPKLKKSLPENIKLFYSKDLSSALKNADIIFIGIASEGFVNVFQMMLDNLDPERQYYFFKLTKGFVEYEGRVIRATEAAIKMYEKKFKSKEFYWTSVGGPVRAMDLAYKTPSASMYGISDKTINKILSGFSTDYYRIFPTYDLAGVEICSTFKNIYAIASGICDGIYKNEREGFYHNIVAFLFNQAVIEISKIAELYGRKKETVFDLAGIGDLHVTSAAGRNRRYGEMVGKGIDGEAAFIKMYDEGEYGEGYIALKLAMPWFGSLKVEKKYIENELPLLYTLNSIIFHKAEPKQNLKKLITRLGY